MKHHFCPKFKAILKADTPDGDMLVTRTRCKMWACDYCAQVNRQIWVARALHAYDEIGGSWQFATITAHEKWRGEASSLKNIRTNIDKWQKRLIRKIRSADTGHYVRILEHHKKDASIHAHYVWQGRTTKKWAKDSARACGLGFMADVQDIERQAGVAYYVTKYMVKDMGQFPKHVRRIVTSQGFPNIEPEAQYEWRISSAVFEEDLTAVYGRGGRVIDIDTGESLTYDATLETGYYPEFPV